MTAARSHKHIDSLCPSFRLSKWKTHGVKHETRATRLLTLMQEIWMQLRFCELENNVPVVIMRTELLVQVTATETGDLVLDWQKSQLEFSLSIKFVFF